MEQLGAASTECGVAVRQLADGLRAAGLLVTHSFDLQSARRALRDPDGCPCPHHGTVDCTCQYIVLLVEDGSGRPITLVAHGHDGVTQLSAEGLAAASSTADTVRGCVAALLVDSSVDA